MTRSSITLHPLTLADLPAADRIRARIGWNQTVDDWQRLLTLDPAGAFVARVEDRVVGTVTTTRYNEDLGWIGMVLVDPDHQKQGIGTRLLRHAIDALHATGVGAVGLDATPAGKILYDKWGFVPVWDLARWEFSGEIAEGSDAGTVAIEDHLWPQIVALDQAAFGVERSALLQALARQGSGCAVMEGDTVRGFGMVRPGSNAAMLGPLIAHDAASARQILAALWRRSPSPRLFWDIPAPNHAAVDIAQSLGFTPQRPLTRMVLGPSYPAHDPTILYAIADLATG